ncbi:MAG: tetratricopeptide repeat protein [Pseudolabrys sp.]
MLAAIRTTACAVALAATASLGPAQAQQSQARTWCYASEANGVSLDLRISGCTTVIQSGKVSNNDLAVAHSSRGNAYRRKGQHDRAIEDYDLTSMRIDPHTPRRRAMKNKGSELTTAGPTDDEWRKAR